MTASARSIELAEAAVVAAADKLASDLTILDVSDQLVITDCFVLASAPSDRQVRAVVDAIEEQLLQLGGKPGRRAGGTGGGGGGQGGYGARASATAGGCCSTTSTSSYMCSTARSAPTTRSNASGKTVPSCRFPTPHVRRHDDTDSPAVARRTSAARPDGVERDRTVSGPNGLAARRHRPRPG